MKSYRQFCGVAKALDLLGERWTLLVVRDLLLGPRRFTDLARSLHGITPNLLSKRLSLLEENGVIERTKEAPSSRAYVLTERGRSLEGVVLGLGSFGAQFMATPNPGDRMNPRSAMLSLKRRYCGSKISGVIAISIDEDEFGVRFGGSHIEIRDVHPERPDATLSGAAFAWFPLLSKRVSLKVLEADGRLSRTGSIRAAAAFVRSIGGLA